ncbi:MAG: glycosyltransferase family 4 protein [Acholeplasmataceae bacterium]
MKIAIDCRYLGMSGISRYLSGILTNIDYSMHDYYLIGDREKIVNLPYKANHIYTDHSPFSIRGLFLFPTKQVNKLDAFFTPHFLIPFGLNVPTYSTIHDMIFFDKKETSHNLIDQLIKKYLVKRSAKKSTKIFTISNFSYKRIIHYFPWKSSDIIITYIGVSQELIDYKIRNSTVKNKQMICVGNLKSHKGIDKIIRSFKELDLDYKLIIVGSDNLKNKIKLDINSSKIIYSGHVSDQELFYLIQSSEILIQASNYEGFGLPPLEALVLNTKVILSDIEVFKEIYCDYDVLFFELNSIKSLNKTIIESIKNKDSRDESSKILNQFNYRNVTDIIIKTFLNGVSNESTDNKINT